MLLRHSHACLPAARNGPAQIFSSCKVEKPCCCAVLSQSLTTAPIVSRAAVVTGKRLKIRPVGAREMAQRVRVITLQWESPAPV